MLTQLFHTYNYKHVLAYLEKIRLGSFMFCFKEISHASVNAAYKQITLQKACKN